MHVSTSLKILISVYRTSLLIFPIPVGTFDVQDVDTNIHEWLCGCVDIICYFTRKSDAKECRIVVQTLQGITSCEFVASKGEEDKATVTVTLSNGTYTLMVYDEEDGVQNPAFTTALHMLCGAQVSGMKFSVL